MTKRDREDIKKSIASEIIQAQKDIKILIKKREPIEPDCCIGRLSRSEAMLEAEIAASTLQSIQSKLGRLQFVSRKVDSDEFGECQICGDEINIERLKVIPESTICIECANNRNS